jgi:hypothetical protein
MNTIRRIARRAVFALAVASMLTTVSGTASATGDQDTIVKATGGYGSVAGPASPADIVKATTGYGEEPVMDSASSVRATGGYGSARPRDGLPVGQDPTGTFLPSWALAALAATAALVAMVAGRRRQRRLANA